MKKITALWTFVLLLVILATTTVFAAPRNPRPSCLSANLMLPIGIHGMMDSLNGIDSSVSKTKVIKGMKRVYRCNLNDDDGTPLWRQTQEAFNHAEEMNADYILIQMSSRSSLYPTGFGTKMLGSNVPVMMFFDNTTASAGALIPLSTDSTRKIKNSQAVVNGTKTSLRTARNSPQANNAATEASKDVFPGSDKTTFTDISPQGMMPKKYEGAAVSVDKVMEVAGIDNYEVVEYKPTVIEKISRALANPFISGALIMLIIGGIYFEMKKPGNGFAVLISLTSAFVYFAPLHLQGLAASWEIGLFITGVLLIVLERFIKRGSITGITGITFATLGLALSLVDHQPSGTILELPYAPAFARALVTVVVSITLSLALSRLLSHRLSYRDASRSSAANA